MLGQARQATRPQSGRTGLDSLSPEDRPGRLQSQLQGCQKAKVDPVVPLQQQPLCQRPTHVLRRHQRNPRRFRQGYRRTPVAWSLDSGALDSNLGLVGRGVFSHFV